MCILYHNSCPAVRKIENGKFYERCVCPNAVILSRDSLTHKIFAVFYSDNKLLRCMGVSCPKLTMSIFQDNVCSFKKYEFMYIARYKHMHMR